MAQETVDAGTLWLVLGIAGSLILILLGVVGVFVRSYMKTIHDDVKANTTECGKNKGRIEQVEQKQELDKQHLEEMTQVKIQALTENVGNLSSNVDRLVNAFISAGMKLTKDE